MMPFHLLSLATGVLLVAHASGQCAQVLHSSGSQAISGSTVTVTSSGVVDVNTSYCTETLPYFIGYNSITGSGEGEYSFHFEPPADSLSLNFSGISNLVSGIEVISLRVNGAHYAIPNAGNTQFCDAWAVLTPEGNITGCDECAVSGWKGTGLSGPITDLVVHDSLVLGAASGSIFSLFMCASLVTGVDDHANFGQRTPYPNPTTEAFHVDARGATHVAVDLYDARGRMLSSARTSEGGQLRISTTRLSPGIYTAVVQRDDIRSVHVVCVE